MDEYIVPLKIFKRISSSSLTVKDLEYVNSIEKVRPVRWYSSAHLYSENRNNIFSEFPLTIPMALLDSRLIEQALEFETNPDNAIVSGYRKI